jgi:DNA replication protein DnaC
MRDLQAARYAADGKSWLACAQAHKACRDGYTVHYTRVPRLFAALELQHGDGRFPQLFRTLTKAIE